MLSLTDYIYFSELALSFSNNFFVKQARIALERRRFLKNANAAVHRQTTWSNLAHEMTAEFRGLCAEEVVSFIELQLSAFLDSKFFILTSADNTTDIIFLNANCFI